MEIKIRDKQTGIIYSNKSNDHCILSINFSDESTDFEVQDKIIDTDGKKIYKRKYLSIYDTSNLVNSLICAISVEDLAEWVIEQQ